MSLPSWLEKLMASGLTDKMSRKLATRVRLANLLGPSMAALIVPFLGLLLSLGMPREALVGLPFALGYALIPAISATGRIWASRFLLVLVANLDVFVYSGVLETGSAMQIFYIPLAFLPTVFFETSERKSCLLSATLPILCFALDHAIGARFASHAAPALHNELVLVLFLPASLVLIFGGIQRLWREQAEDERLLAEEAARLKGLMEALPDPLFRFRRDGTCLDLHCPEGYELAVPPEKLLGRKVNDVAPWEEGPRFLAAIAEVLATGAQASFQYEIQRGSRTRCIDGRLVKTGADEVIFVAQDVTEQRDQARLIEQQRVKMIAASRLTLLGEMSGGIAHEINNPLAIIHGKAEQLRRVASQGPLEPKQILTHAEKIAETAMRIARIVQALRSFARDAEREPMTLVPVERLVSETLDLCRARFREHSIDFHIDPIASGMTLECRQVQISQALMHLLGNAHDAVASLPERWVRLSVEERGGMMQFAVTDSGPGIPAPIREKILHPFFTTKDPGVSTGLGLSVSLGLVTSHGGRLELDTRSPQTRFVISLPARQRPAAAAA